MPKPKKKVITDDKSIDQAEQKLGIKYPPIIRDKLKEHNGFYWGYFRFFCVFDEEDKFHTFDDVVRENENPSAGWKQYLPEGHVAIANEDLLCLTLNTNKDGKVYFYDHGSGKLEVFAESDEELQQKLDEQGREFNQ
jgi:hypothetical protein